MKLWLTGGHQGRAASTLDRAHEPLYDEAVLGWLDTATGEVGRTLGHRSAPALCGGHPQSVGHTFKAASRCGDTLWLCTEREVLEVDARSGSVRSSWSDPWLNDVHHVRMIDGDLHVVCSGLDAVLRVHSGQPLFEPVVPGGLPPDRDVRAVSLKPHIAHPNHIVEVAGERWVTRGRLGDLYSLDTGKVVPVADVPIHDGLPHEGGLLVSAVDGRLLHVEPRTGRCSTVVDLRTAPEVEPLGWCRGVAVVDQVAWVGFTRIRATRMRHSLAWVRGRLRGRPVATRRPTRVVAVELGSGRVLREVELACTGIDALFSVVPSV